jgi:uncharacterized protein (TIGR03437 family)
MLAMAALASLTPAQAYYHYVHYSSRNAPFDPIYEKFDLNALGSARTVTFFVSDQGPAVYAPNDSFGSLLGQVKHAVATWDLSTSDLRVAFGGLETQGQRSNSPSGDVVFQELPPGLLGMGAPTTNGATIIRGTVILSNNTNVDKGAGPSYLEGFFTTAVHEVGHALGLQHTWTGSAMSQDVIRNTSRARPLDADDIAAFSVLYGKAGWQAGYGSISGRVTFTNGQPVTLASVVALCPTGPAVSTLTNPDGTYRIDGIPANNYLLYVHPLPPDAILPDESGIRLPVDPNGQRFQPANAFGTVFYPGVIDPTQAATISISRGSVVNGQNFLVQARSSVPAFDLITFSFLDASTHTSLYATDARSVPVTPAFINSNQASMFVKVRANSGDTPVPQSATVLGGFGTAKGEFLVPYADDSTGHRSLALYFGMPLFAGTGLRHMVFNFGNDIYVLPGAINLVQKPVPAITNVTSNSDGTVTLTGTSLAGDSRIYFDGLQAIMLPAALNDSQGSIKVLPPPGAGGQVASITVFNGDGQNSTFIPTQNPPVYVYPPAFAPSLAGIGVTSLPAGATSMIDITAQNVRFVDGQVTVGFGSGDVAVKRVWVLSPNHVQVNVAVSANAAVGSSEISVISGFQVMSFPGAFQTLPANSSLPVIELPAINGNSNQQTIYPGSTVTIFGVNLALSPANFQVTLNDIPVQVLFAGASQVNFLIPAGFPTGLAVLKVNNGSAAANQVLLQIDAPPPTIVSVTNPSGVAYDAAHIAGAGDVVNVLLSNLDPGVLNNPSRLQVTVSGVAMPVQFIVSAGNGLYQVQFVLPQSFGGTPVPLAVLVDGSSSSTVSITVR